MRKLIVTLMLAGGLVAGMVTPTLAAGPVSVPPATVVASVPACDEASTVAGEHAAIPSQVVCPLLEFIGFR